MRSLWRKVSRKEKGNKMKITDIFRIICDSLNLGDAAYENQISDFFALLATENKERMGEVEKKLVQSAAGFLGRQMEQ